MLQKFALGAVLMAVFPWAIPTCAESANQQRDRSIVKIPVLMPGSEGVTGRERPEGLLCILGDDRVRLSGYPTNILPSLDGKRLFAATSTNVLDVIDPQTMLIVESFRAADSRVMEIAIAPDGKRLAVAGLDGKVIVWDVSSIPARRLASYTPFEGSGKQEVWLNLSTSRDRVRFCVSADTGVTVFEWTPDGLATVCQQRSEFAFKPALLAPDGQRLVVRPKTPSEFQLWDLRTSPAKVLHRLTIDKRFPTAMCFQNNDVFLAAAHAFGAGNSHLVSIAGDKLEISAVLERVVANPFRNPLFLDEGSLCLAATKTNGDALFKCSAGQWEPLQTFPPRGGEGAMPLGVSPDNNSLYVSTDQVPSALNRQGELFVRRPSATPDSTLGRIENLAFLRDGTLIFSTRGTVHVVALGEPTQPRPLPPIRFKAELNGSCHLIPHPTDEEFALIETASGDLIQIRNRGADFEEVRRFSYGTGPEKWKEAPWSAGYTPDGTTLAVGFWDRSIRLYSNGHDGLRLRSTVPDAAGGHVCVLTFAPDTQSLACGDFGSNARLIAYNGELGRQSILPKFGAAVRSAQFSPDGSHVVFGSQDGEIRLTNLASNPHESRLLLRPMEEPPKPNDANGGVTSLSWVGDGKLLLTAKGRSGQTEVTLWKMPSAEVLQSWTFTGWMRAAIDHDGFMVAVARSDGTVCILQVSDEAQRWLNEAP